MNMKPLTFTDQQMQHAINTIAMERAMGTLPKDKTWAVARLNEVIKGLNPTYPASTNAKSLAELRARFLYVIMRNNFQIDTEIQDWYHKEDEPDGNSLRDEIKDAIRFAFTKKYGLELSFDYDEFIYDLADTVFDTLCMEEGMQDMDYSKYAIWMTDGVNLDDLNLE